MSAHLFFNSKDGSFNNKLIYENSKSNYNNFRHYSSLIKKNNPKNKYFINTSSNIQKFPHKLRYITTEENFSNNNFCSCVNDQNTLNPNNSNYYKNSQNIPNKYLPSNYKLFNINKNKIYSANLNLRKKLKTINDDNKKENEIYLNNFINSSSDEKIQKRIQSSKGFLRKIDYELEQILSNKNKKKYFTINKNFKNDKYIDTNIHENNYIFEYSTDDYLNDKNKIKKNFYYNTINKDKNINTIYDNNNNIEEKGNYFYNVINDITRKVEFLNTKNNIISDENTMNLLNNEEYYLYKKMDNFFKDNYSIKKFSKSIYDENNGNKYLLPLFNNKIIIQNHPHANKNKKNKSEKKNLNDKFSKYKLIQLNTNNNITINEHNKRIVKVYILKKSKEKEKKKINILFFPANIEKVLPEFENNKKDNNLSYDKKNIIKIYHKRKKRENEILIGKNKNNKNEIRKSLINMNVKKGNNLDNFIIENTRIINDEYINNIKPIPKKKDIFQYENDFKKNNTININQKWNYKFYTNKKYTKNNSEENKNITWDEKDFNQENDISKINKYKNKNKNKINKNQKLKENNKLLNQKDDDDDDDYGNIKTNENKEEKKQNKKEILDNYEKKKRESRLMREKMKHYNEVQKYLRLPPNQKNFGMNKNININNKNGKKLDLKDFNINEDDENSSDISISLDIVKEEEKLKELKKISLSNNLILKKNIEIEEKKLVARIEKKKSKTVKFLFQYIKRNIKETIKKESIQNLLTHNEFREIVNLLKIQINKSREITNQDPSKVISPITDDEIVTLLYTEISKEEENINKSANNSKVRKSTYIPEVHLKGKNDKNMHNNMNEIIEEKESEEVLKIKKEREKEKEKLKYMVNEMTLSNELRFHIQETNNKELRERFQTILTQIESYQNLNMSDYVEAIKNNYLLLKEEMNKIISDKEMEDRINGFVSNLDIERNVLESKWNYLNDRLNIIDNRFHTYMEKLDKNKKKEK